MGDIGAQTAAHNAMPSWQIHLIELCLDNLCDVVQYTPLCECKRHAVDRMLLHVLVHVGVLHHGILCVLLVESAMRLHNLRVGVFLPLFGL